MGNKSLKEKSILTKASIHLSNKPNMSSEQPSKMHGTKDKVVGAIKEKTGHILGKPELEAKGEQQKETGKQEVESAKSGQRTQGYGEQVHGGTKEVTGKVVGNKQMENEGAAKKKEGEVRVNANQ